jgi:hypothetical protein
MGTIKLWFKHFELGNKSLEDQHMLLHSVTETTKLNIKRVHEVIEDYPYCAYDEIDAESTLTRSTIQNTF